jgi:hypothetical protein
MYEEGEMKNICRYFYAVLCMSFLVLLFHNQGFAGKAKETAAIKVLSIPAPAFEMPGEMVAYTNNGRLWLNSGAAYVRAPLILPNKTRIKKVQLVCKDNNPTGDLRLWLHVLSNDLSESFTMCLVESEDAAEGYRIFTTTDIKPNKIDNVKYNYFLNLRLLGSDEDGYAFIAAKVWYKGSW